MPDKQAILTPIHVRRVNIRTASLTDGEGDLDLTRTRDWEVLDLLDVDGVHYLVRTTTHFCYDYDFYRSTPDRFEERVILECFPIPTELCNGSEEAILAHIEGQEPIRGEMGTVFEPTEGFVTEYVGRLLGGKWGADAEPNALFISYGGRPTGVHVSDYSSPEGPASVLCAYIVEAGAIEGNDNLMFFHDPRKEMDRPYNAAATAAIGHYIEGAALICGRCADGSPSPLSAKRLEEIAHAVQHNIHLWHTI